MIERPFRAKRTISETPAPDVFQLSPPPVPIISAPGIEPETAIVPFCLTHPSLRRNNNISSVNKKKKIRKYADPFNVRRHKAHLACVARQKLPPSLLQQHLAKSYRIAAAVMEFQRKNNSPPPSWSCNIDAIVTERVDEFNLPVCAQGGREPEWVIKRREFLKKLSVSQRNLLLTGDPFFQFDPVVYDCIFNLPSFATPPFLHNHFPYLNPQIIEAEDLVEPNIENEQPLDIHVEQPEPIEPENRQFQDQFTDPMSHSSSSSDSEPCGAMNPPPPPGAASPPSTTRSGKKYGHLEQRKATQASSSGAASSFLSRATKTVGRLLDNHPLSNQHANPRRKNDG